ncbi:carbohydrate-binding module family 50 protein [Aulographum hederae CBS 113979]|uniref:Carbohydrate-binding module family 50 protein n=1 Tax=Aulographum hederae CBS 113979 TaxID=1176131 RepID=A0A6G1GSG1_9PEZI|nr:carbohydrate-binding module family 50 protein [Aulographum hederae CBS 113979]
MKSTTLFSVAALLITSTIAAPAEIDRRGLCYPNPLPPGTSPADPSIAKDCSVAQASNISGEELPDSCASLCILSGCSSADFLAWNPSLEGDCKNISLGEYYCISTVPTPGLGPGC